MIGPTADPVQPRFKHLKLAVIALRVQRFEQKHSGNLFLEYGTREQLVRHFGQKRKVVLAQNLTPASPNRSSQCSRVPPVRLDLFFEEPLHSRRVLRRPAIF